MSSIIFASHHWTVLARRRRWQYLTPWHTRFYCFSQRRHTLLNMASLRRLMSRFRLRCGVEWQLKNKGHCKTLNFKPIQYLVLTHNKNVLYRKYLISHQGGGGILFGLAFSENSGRHQTKSSRHCHRQHQLRMEKTLTLINLNYFYKLKII